MKKISFPLFISLVLLMSIFSCFTKTENLESWLNKKFPGQYVVVDTKMNILPSIYKEKKRESVVALKADPEVQFEILWYKNAPDLRVTKEEIERETAQSKKEVEQTRQLFQAVQSQGAARMSVAIIDSAAYFLVYEDPNLDNRKKYLNQILSMLNGQHDHAQTSIFIEFMEDSVYQKEFKDIIPKGYWNRVDKHYEHHKIVALDFEWKPGLKVENLMPHWAVNTESDKTFIYMADAYQVALKWSEKNISAPFYLEPVQMVQYEIDQEDPMAIHFQFPYFSSKPPEESDNFKIIGYVKGIYQTDMKTFSKIKTVKEENNESE